MPPFTRQTLEAFLLDELRTAHPTIELAIIAVPESSTEFVVEVRAPVKFIRIFRPSLKGTKTHARVFAAEISHALDDYARGGD